MLRCPYLVGFVLIFVLACSKADAPGPVPDISAGEDKVVAVEVALVPDLKGELDVDVEADPGTEPEPDPGTEPEPDPGIEPEPDPGSAPDPGAEPDPGPLLATDTDGGSEMPPVITLPPGLVGEAAPNNDAITEDLLAGVVDETGTAVSIDQVLGHWTVLWFYPKANTSG